MNAADNAYGLWGLVILNSVIFVGFAYSFFKPNTLRDWRSARRGVAWRFYAAVTPRFIPHFSKDDRARPVNSH